MYFISEIGSYFLQNTENKITRKKENYLHYPIFTSITLNSSQAHFIRDDTLVVFCRKELYTYHSFIKRRTFNKLVENLRKVTFPSWHRQW